MIRAFIAVEFPSSIVQQISSAIDGLRPRIEGVRWVSPSNFHLTLKFLGDIPESQVDDLFTALAPRLRPFPRCTINAKGLGVFPDVKRPRILWVGLASDELVEMARRIDASLQPLGFAPEKRGFTPHLTIGRWRQIERAPKTLASELEKWRAAEFGRCQVNEVILFQSILRPAGAEYHKLKTIALGAE